MIAPAVRRTDICLTNLELVHHVCVCVLCVCVYVCVLVCVCVLDIIDIQICVHGSLIHARRKQHNSAEASHQFYSIGFVH